MVGNCSAIALALTKRSGAARVRRLGNRGGRKVMARRRAKGRWRVTA